MTINNNFGYAYTNVLGVIKQRRRSEYEPNSLSDGNKVALVVEGGGMRGVISSAALDMLERLGYSNCFDIVSGTSAGAINGAYFLSKQMDRGTSVYYEDLTCKEFINLMRYPEIMNLDFLFEILGSDPHKSFIYDDFKSSKADFFVSLTNTNDGTLKYLNKSNFKNGREVLRALKASSSTPLFTDNSELIESSYYNDGLVHEGIPITPALSQRATHVVAILTREYGYRKKTQKLIEIAEKLRLSKYSKEYKNSYFKRHARYNAALEILNNPANDLSTLIIAPQSKFDVVKSSEVGKDILERAAITSMRNVSNILEVSDISVNTALYHRPKYYTHHG